jgi:hypothetical protein
MSSKYNQNYNQPFNHHTFGMDNKNGNNVYKNNSNKKCIRLIKIFIYEKMSLNAISNIILRKLNLSNIELNNNSNVKNIILLHYENASYNMTQALKKLLIKKLYNEKERKINLGNIYMDVKINPYLRKCLAYMCYQDKFVKYGISNQLSHILIKKRLELHTQYLEYCNKMYSRFEVNENYIKKKNSSKSSNSSKNKHCNCCNCNSKENNYSLEYKYLPYLMYEPVNKLINSELSYWIVE